MGSLRLPAITDVAISSVDELLAFAAGLVQISGNLKSGEDEVVIGDPVAWDSSAEKFINYNHGGSGDEIVCVGFVRIPGDPESADVPIEVVIAGAVKYSVVSVASAWHSAIITDLKARYVVAADALLFF